MKARIVIGCCYGDEGKGTVVAHYTKHSDGNVLNILTNGGSQRGHSILTEDGSITFQHFGSGTYHGADSYYSRFFIMNPMQFVKEYEGLIVKPQRIYRDKNCRWSTPYDSIANLITEQQKDRHASCCMGIWNTVKRYRQTNGMSFDDFIKSENPLIYLENVKRYYEREVTIPEGWKEIWNSRVLMQHFLNDCKFLYEHTIVAEMANLGYESLIFENGQGLLLCDTGKDTFDTTPSNTGIAYSLELLKGLNVDDVTAHYVTRPYLTRHGDGEMLNQSLRSNISSGVNEDRTNHFNDFQGEFRYGLLDLDSLKERIEADHKNADNLKVEIELTHCDEMDRLSEFKKEFDVVNTYDSPLIS